MSRDYANKDFLRYRSPKKNPWMKRMIILVILCVLFYFLKGHFSVMDNQFERIKHFFKENKTNVQKKVSDMIPVLPKPPSDSEIHFEFYDTLPAMQVKSISPSKVAGTPPPKLELDQSSRAPTPLATSSDHLENSERIFENPIKLNSKNSETEMPNQLSKHSESSAMENKISEEDTLSQAFSEHLKQHQQPSQKSARYQILLATFNTEVAAKSYRDRLPAGNRVSIIRSEIGGHEQYRVLVLGHLSEAEAKTILLKYQKAGWAMLGKIQLEKGE